MAKLGQYTAKKTGIKADFVRVRFNGQHAYLCKIKGKVYRMNEEEFRTKWFKEKVEVKQERLL